MKKQGFSLVELLVVLVVIGVILGFVIPAATGVFKTSEKKECETFFKAAKSAAYMCHTDNGNDSTTCNQAAVVNVNYMEKAKSPEKCVVTVTAAAAAGTPSTVTAQYDGKDI